TDPSNSAAGSPLALDTRSDITEFIDEHTELCCGGRPDCLDRVSDGRGQLHPATPGDRYIHLLTDQRAADREPEDQDFLTGLAERRAARCSYCHHSAFLMVCRDSRRQEHQPGYGRGAWLSAEPSNVGGATG